LYIFHKTPAFSLIFGIFEMCYNIGNRIDGNNFNPTKEHDMKTATETEFMIAEERTNANAIPSVYRFGARRVKSGTRFFLSVHTATETCEADAGTDFFDALELYRKIIRGGVTPCTLPDIALDFAFDQSNR
jgi:hypothetical protein